MTFITFRMKFFPIAVVRVIVLRVAMMLSLVVMRITIIMALTIMMVFMRYH